MADGGVIVEYHPSVASTGRRLVWIFHPAALEKAASKS